MTYEQAREWTLRNWNADEDGTDLIVDDLEEAYQAVFDRMPLDEEDAFGDLKHHFTTNQ